MDSVAVLKWKCKKPSASPEAAQGVVAACDRALHLEFAECWFRVFSISTVCVLSLIQHGISPLPRPGRGLEEASELGTALRLGYS